jgi:hypothetical protein
VLRNERALPWAWVVHEVRVATATEPLDLLDRGEVDPRRTVLLEPPAAGLASMATDAHAEGANESATVVAYEADHLLIRTQTAADGILVLSEVAYPGWVAAVDGAPTPIYVANGLLRAVPLPAGAHLVDLRFESPTLKIGIGVSLATAALLLGVCAAAVRRQR